MPKQSRPDSEKPGTLGAPDEPPMREPAEGSRENVNISEANESDRGRGNGGGITNRPLEQEEHEQAELPARGKAKEGGHA
jgi:hypothetical protein